jgi:hypothetical protein
MFSEKIKNNMVEINIKEEKRNEITIITISQNSLTNQTRQLKYSIQQLRSYILILITF